MGLYGFLTFSPPLLGYAVLYKIEEKEMAEGKEKTIEVLGDYELADAFAVELIEKRRI